MVKILKILRITAWLLLIATPVALFSGFFMVKFNLVPWASYGFSSYIHKVIVPLFFIPLFYLHSLAGLLVLTLRYKWTKGKYFRIVVVVLWTLLCASFIFLYVIKNPTPQISQDSLLNNQPQIILNAAEVAKHNSIGDCWSVVNNKVYNLTSLVNGHSGGEAAILANCGKDGTQAFATKNSSTPHSSGAKNILSSLYIGDLGNSITSQELENINTQIQNLPTRREVEDD